MSSKYLRNVARTFSHLVRNFDELSHDWNEISTKRNFETAKFRPKESSFERNFDRSKFRQSDISGSLKTQQIEVGKINCIARFTGDPFSRMLEVIATDWEDSSPSGMRFQILFPYTVNSSEPSSSSSNMFAVRSCDVGRHEWKEYALYFGFRKVTPLERRVSNERKKPRTAALLRKVKFETETFAVDPIVFLIWPHG